MVGDLSEESEAGVGVVCRFAHGQRDIVARYTYSWLDLGRVAMLSEAI